MRSKETRFPVQGNSYFAPPALFVKQTWVIHPSIWKVQEVRALASVNVNLTMISRNTGVWALQDTPSCPKGEGSESSHLWTPLQVPRALLSHPPTPSTHPLKCSREGLASPCWSSGGNDPRSSASVHSAPEWPLFSPRARFPHQPWTWI